MDIQTTAVSLAFVVAGLFATAVPTTATAGANSEVHYYGVNACKGQAACQGNGFVVISEVAEQENGFTKVSYRSRGFKNRGSVGRFKHRRGFSHLGRRSFGKFKKFNRKGFGYYRRFHPKFGNRSYGKYANRRYF